MLKCSRLVVRGDVRFGKNVVMQGEVELVNNTGRAVEIDDGAVLTGKVEF